MADCTVSLEIEKRAGTLSSAALALRRYGLFLQHHHTETTDDESHQTLILEADGALDDLKGLCQRLEGIRGVVRVASINSGAEPVVIGTVGEVDDDGADVDDDADKDIVDRIIDRFPNIMGPIEELEAVFKGRQRENHLRGLGYAVGERLGQNYTPHHRITDLNGALQYAVAPLLGKLATLRVEDNRIIAPLSALTRRYANQSERIAEGDVEPCHFISGFIEGVLSTAGNMSAVTVNEINCRSLGGKECVFEVRPM